MGRVLRKTLLLAALTCPGWAGAVQYGGHLIPGNYASPIPITLDLETFEGQVEGRAQLLIPSPAEAAVSGESRAGYCSLTLVVDGMTRANLRGNCGAEEFVGNFRLYTSRNRKLSGTFSLKAAEPEKAVSGAEAPKKPGRSACLNRNLACLRACPREDYNQAFLCTNACRRRNAACLGKGVKGEG